MLAELDDVVGTLESIVRSLDPAVLVPADAAELTGRFTTIANLSSTGRAICARRAVEGRQHERAGYRDPAVWLGAVSGEGTGKSRDALVMAGQLESLPNLNEAARRGELSPAQAGLIASAGALDAGSEGELVDIAKRRSMRELGEAAERAKAAARSAEQDEERYRRVHLRRSFRSWTADDGTAHGHLTTTPDAMAEIVAALEATRKEIFAEARAAGRREPYDAYLADALHDLVTGQRTGGPAKVEVFATVDLSALLRGSLEPGEACTLDGVGPVPVSVIRRKLASAEAELSIVVTEENDVRSIVHTKRTISRDVRRALKVRDKRCVVPGCSVRVGLEADHIVPFAAGGLTCLANLCLLCGWHHYLKTHKGWQIQGGPGNWDWVPPAPPGEPSDRAPDDALEHAPDADSGAGSHPGNDPPGAALG